MKEAKSLLERVTGVQALLRFDHHEQLRSREMGISFSVPSCFLFVLLLCHFHFLCVNLALHHTVHYKVSQTTLYIFIIIWPDLVFAAYLLLAHRESRDKILQALRYFAAVKGWCLHIHSVSCALWPPYHCVFQPTDCAWYLGILYLTT